MTAKDTPIDPIRAIFAFCATLFFVLSPLVTTGFAGFTPDQFPIPQDQPPIQPAGYAFAIWGLIYLWLMVSAVFGLFKRASDPGWERTRLPLILSLAPGAAWIGVANLSPLWATVLIWWMLLTALWTLAETPDEDWLWLRFPVGLYAGWLTAASWVSVGMIGAGWGIGPGQIGWALFALSGAFATGAYIVSSLPAIGYALALIWALVALVVANIPNTPLIAVLAGLAAAGIVVMMIRRA